MKGPRLVADAGSGRQWRGRHNVLLKTHRTADNHQLPRPISRHPHQTVATHAAAGCGRANRENAFFGALAVNSVTPIMQWSVTSLTNVADTIVLSLLRQIAFSRPAVLV